MDPMISYESIRAVHRAEKGEGLSKLPEGFFLAVRRWLNYKQGKKDTNSLLEAESAKKLLEDIINRRQRKIIFSALASVRGAAPPQNMTEEEGKFFDEVVKLLKSHQTEAKERLFGSSLDIEEKVKEARESIEEMRMVKEIKPEKESASTAPQPKAEGLKPLNKAKKVKILIELPRFIGTDGKEYGPFKIGDVVEMPEEVFDLLAMRQAAEAIEER